LARGESSFWRRVRRPHADKDFSKPGKECESRWAHAQAAHRIWTILEEQHRSAAHQKEIMNGRIKELERQTTSRRARYVAIPIGDEGRFVWSFAWPGGDHAARAAGVLRRALRKAEGLAGIAIDLAAASAPFTLPARTLLDLAEEIQRRGIGVVAIGPGADLLTEISMGDSTVRLPWARDLTEALDLFRRFEEIGARSWTIMNSSRAVRAPAREGSVAPLCRALRTSLEENGVPRGVGESVLQAASAILWNEVLPACDPAHDRISLCATLRGSSLTVTILDPGRGPRAEMEPRMGALRIHRFWVLDRHHATVLERSDARLHSGDVVR